MPAPRDVQLLVKVARMYFQDGASQQEIADAVGVSRSNVSRMLAAAREQRIVEIRINDPSGRDVELEAALRQTFGLKDVRVAGAAETESALRAGELAGAWLVEALPGVRTLALSWGATLQSVVWSIRHTGARLDCEVVPLVGGLSSINFEATGQELVRELAERIGASYRYLHAPALLQSAEAVEALLAEKSISDALAYARSADVALVGIGAVTHGSSAGLLDQLQLSPKERAEFDRQRPVGDLCARFFDAQGRAVRGAVHDRVLAVTLEDLRSIPTVVAVAVGVSKKPGVLGALRGRLVDVLVCDADLANALLADDGGDLR